MPSTPPSHYHHHHHHRRPSASAPRTATKLRLAAAAAVVVAAAAALSPAAVVAQDLFGGDKCSFAYDSFASAPAASDLTVQNGKVTYSGGSMVLTLQPPTDGSGTGRNALVATSRALLYGTVEARVKQGPIGGVITAFTLMNYQTLDEIDFEWVGSDRNNAWTNFFYRGRRERDAATTFEIWASHPAVSSDTAENFHDYKIEWTPYALTWSIDGAVVHSQNRSGTWEPAGTGDLLPYDHYHYPDTPVLVTLGVWNSNEVAWANGPIDWTQASAQNGFTAEFASLKVSCYQGPYPSDMSAPPTDPRSSDQGGTGPGQSSPTSITGGAVTIGGTATSGAATGSTATGPATTTKATTGSGSATVSTSRTTIPTSSALSVVPAAMLAFAGVFLSLLVQ
ncbi:concanavalin A-like lectin/glucanase domain-containing protein [Zopfochytrium polystomum]|nr:concanavalin A-like lectin/glucanase domain-containing protein [Zopfochytrium polystomum]